MRFCWAVGFTFDCWDLLLTSGFAWWVSCSCFPRFGFGLEVGFRHESSFGFALNFDLVLMFCFGCLCWFSGCVGCGGFWLLVLEFCWLWIRLLFDVFVVVV